MAKNVAAPKNTGGGGYVFETKVVARIFACMLARRSLLDTRLGVPVRVDFQTRPGGWFLDDALVTSRSTTFTHRFALSVKSNAQFTAASAPSDFVESIWEQWLHIGSSVFSQANDYLVLLTAPPSDAARQSLEGLSRKLLPADPQIFPAYMDTPKWANENERRLFSSFHCPLSLNVSPPPSREDTARLLKQLRFVHCDFESAVSDSLNHSLWLCALCVRSGSKTDSEKLWDRLCKIADNHRQVAGAITLEDLIDQLRNDFELADSPDYTGDWVKLDGVSAQNAASVPNKIGGIVDLPRSHALDVVEEAISNGEIIAILGTSGAGKSVLARKIFEKRMQSLEQTVWVDARSLECSDLSVFEATLKLSYPLRELLAKALSAAPILIVDGLDRIYDDVFFRNAATLLRISRHVAPATRWRILILCQSSEWARVSERLAAAGVQETIETVRLQPIVADDLISVVDSFPALASLLAQPRVAKLLLNLKVLDLVARKVREGMTVAGTQWVSELSVAGWFWDVEVSKGSNHVARGRFVRDLAQRQADQLLSAVSVDEFEASGLAALPSLQADQICQNVANDRLAFSHDLYGDWTRLRILRNNRQELAGFLDSRGDSPLWQRALRLLGAEVLDLPNGVSDWKAVLGSLSESRHTAAKDAFLEGPLYSSNVQEHLEALLPVLLEQDGALLNRLLTRFLAFATGPGRLAEAFKAIPNEKGIDLSLIDRVPNHPVWPQVIKFLHEHRRIILALQAPKISELVVMWLESAPSEARARNEAAELGVELGKCAIADFKDWKRALELEGRRLLYRCMLLSAGKFPDEVGALALEASGRAQHAPVDDAPHPWPDGPRTEVDEAFRSAVLDGRGMQSLFSARPALAREVILATMVRFPARSPIIEFDRRRRDSPVLERMRWLPTIYIHGPFLMCLSLNFNEGLELIVRLVDLATNNGLPDEQSLNVEDDAGGGDRESLTLVMKDGLKQFSGNGNTFLSNMGASNLPRVVTIALMALEQYLYMYIEAGKDISAMLEAILARCSSVAILGVLADVGKREPTLFLGPLRPLLSNATIFLWDLNKGTRGRTHLLMVGPNRLPKIATDMAVAFNGLAHRKTDLRIHFAEMVETQPAPAEYLTRVREQWIQVSDKDPLVAAIRAQLIGFLDPEWRVKGIERATQDALGSSTSERAQLSEYDGVMNRAAFLTITLRCRRILDSSDMLDQAQLEDWWQCCKSLVKDGRPSNSTFQDALGDEWDNAVSGCIAVLLRHPDWSTEDVSRKGWMTRTLLALWHDQPQRTIDVDESLSPLSWECFMAESAARLWIEDIDNHKLREWVAQMVFTLRKFDMRQTLFQACAMFRTSIGDDFYRLRRLAMDAAFLKVRCQLLSQYPEHFGVDKTQLALLWQKIEIWVTDEIEAFVQGALPAELVPWQEYDGADLFPVIEAKRIEWGHPALDLDVVRSAHTWLPLPNHAQNEVERVSIVQFWKDSASFIAKRAAARHEYYEMEDDTWVLESLGAVLLQCEPEDEPHLLWRPVFELPSAWHAFPESLMSALHRSALLADEAPKYYVTTVRSVGLHALRSNGETPTWRPREAVWDALLGLNYGCLTAWQAKHESIVRSLLDVFRLWMQEVPLSGERLAVFASWLANPAATPLRLEALRWFDEMIQRDALAGVSDASVAHDKLAALLNEAWNQQEQKIRADKEMFAGFRRTLDWLVAQQNARALALSARLGLV